VLPIRVPPLFGEWMHMFWKLYCGLIIFTLTATTIYAEHFKLCDQFEKLSKRCLNRHLFMPSSQISSPFLTTDLKSNIQMQKGSVVDMSSTPPQRHEGQRYGAHYQLQIGLFDWLAISGQFSGGFLGGAGRDIINFGVGKQFDYSLGTRFLFWKNQRFVISSDLNFIGMGYSGMDLLAFLPQASALAGPMKNCFTGSELTDEEKKDKNAACTSVNKALEKFDYELGFNADISMAMGINPVAGFLANAGYQQLFRSPTNASDFKGQVYGGLSFSLDLSPVTPVPFGLLFGTQYIYRLDNKPSDFLQIGALILHGGIFYTGSQFFSVGLEISDEIVPVGIGPVVDRSNLIAGSLSFHFYWN
jgi:hypothetical protein